MRLFFTIPLILIGLAPELCAQAAPSATGPRDLNFSGSLQYSIRYSQIATLFSSGQSDEQTAIVSGDLTYLNESERHPFKAMVGAGYMWDLAGTGYGDGPFENVDLSQSLVGEHWNLTVGDGARYSKQTPTTGFSGEPGTGEPIGQPNPNPGDQSIVAINTTMVSNQATGEFSHRLTVGTTLSAGGFQTLLRYPSGNGIDTTTYDGHSDIRLRMNARSSVYAGYYYDQYEYLDSDLTLVSNSVLAGYDHQWTRHLSTSVSGGPQWISSNSIFEPGMVTYQANGNVTYTIPHGSAGLVFTHGFVGGSGFFVGSIVDTADLYLQHEYRDHIVTECSLAYRRNEPLDNSGLITGRIAGGQITKTLGRRFSVFAGYTATSQSSSAQSFGGTFSGLWQMLSLGAGFTPPAIHFGR